MPKEAGDVPADMLRFLVAVYLRARYRDKSTVFYKGKHHTPSRRGNCSCRWVNSRRSSRCIVNRCTDGRSTQSATAY